MAPDLRHKVEQEEKWRDFACTMPHIELRKNYAISVYPPYSGAMFRFSIKYLPSNTTYSIYFDAHNNLGIMNYPYYEVYKINDDVYRSDNIYDILREIYCDAENEARIRDAYPEWFL